VDGDVIRRAIGAMGAALPRLAAAGMRLRWRHHRFEQA
jgi:hypothetical protein